MKFESRRIIALLLLFVSITGLVVSFGASILCAGELPGAHASLGHDTPQVKDSNCPCSPSPSNSPSDHFCDGDCGCPCQAPLSFPMVSVSYSPLLVSLQHAEPVRFIPEVYLSKFIPPQKQA
jgi:hypothetical protein